jgi:hypothetical protein
MEDPLDTKRFDRRTVLCGGVSLAAGGILARPGEAGAHAGESAGTAARIAAHVSEDAVVVIPLATDHRIRIELAPGATVVRDGAARLADFSVGEGIVAEGDQLVDGSIAARRVVRGVLGVRSDVRR